MSAKEDIIVDQKKRGKIFDIKRFATGDGPGIRTLVFLKGCPLRCEWCANPESREYIDQIMYYKNKCVGCGKCIDKCPEQAIYADEKFGLKIDSEKCTLCGICVELCYYNAREVIGEMLSVRELMKKILKDKEFYDSSGGGVTLTGGEPLFQADFVLELLKACKKRNINTALETCAYTKWDNISRILPYLDLVFYDIKHLDDTCHQKYTGVSNKVIIENLEKMDQSFDNIIVRVPFIPGYNSQNKYQVDIYDFIATMNNVKRIEVLPYHRLGMNKYFGLGKDYKLKDLEPVNKEELTYLVELGHKSGVEIQIDTE
ncbi:MAG TPA: glycyl-radical enzyme activating protein [Halanaerobiales bacterium]|nr:glycyl-radical enzyme activating protein [Halanaerobiales bacterium]